MRELTIDSLIETQYKCFSRYVIESRAIPSIIDGLKPVLRRSLWIGTKLAKDWVKVCKLAGSTLSLHPHGSTSIEDSISISAQRFPGSNNICWLDGKGAFGSRIVGPGNGIGASRYISVKLSENFYKIMNVDSDIVDFIPNYDDTDKEPKSFLPLIPTVLLNPIQGIAVGFACNILPRKIEDIIHCQLQYLQGKEFREPKVHFEGFIGKIEKIENNIWKTYGVFERKGKQVIITELPIGYTRENYIKVLDSLEEKEVIYSFVDECTESFKFIVDLKSDLTDDEIYEKFKLSETLNENLNIIDIDGKIKNMNVIDIIKTFTEYRLKLYLRRFKKQFFDLKDQFEYDKDLLKVIKLGLVKKFPNLNKNEISNLLLENQIQEKHINKIIQTPIYKLSKEEIEDLHNKLIELKKKLENLIKLCKDETLRKEEYIKELKEL